MAKDSKRLAEIFEYQKGLGKGNVASLTRAMLDLRREQKDIKNRLFGRDGAPKGIMQALARSILGKGFSATPSRIGSKTEKVPLKKEEDGSFLSEQIGEKLVSRLTSIDSGISSLRKEMSRVVDAQKDANKELSAVRIGIAKSLSKKQRSAYEVEIEKDLKASREREKEIETKRESDEIRERENKKEQDRKSSQKSKGGGLLSGILDFLGPIAGFGSKIIGGLFGAAGSLLTGGLGIVATLFTGLFKGLGLAGAGLFGLLGFLGSAFSQMGLIGSIVTFFILKKLFEGTEIGNALDSFGDSVSNFFNGLLKTMGIVGEDSEGLNIGKTFSDLATSLRDTVDYFKNASFETIIDDIAASLRSVANSLREFKLPTLEDLNEKIDNLFADIRKDIQKSIFIVTETIQEYIKAFAQNLQAELLNWFDQNKELLIKSIAMTVGGVAGSIFGVSGAAVGAGLGAASAEIGKLFGGQNMSPEQREQALKELKQQKEKKVIPERMDLESWAKQYNYTDILNTLEQIGDVDKSDKNAQKKLTDQLKNQIQEKGFNDAQITISGRELGLSESGVPQLEPKLEIFGPGIGQKVDSIEELKSKAESAKTLGDTETFEEITKMIREEEERRRKIDEEILKLEKEEKLRTPVPYENIMEDVRKRADQIYEPTNYSESGTMGGYTPPGRPTPVVREIDKMKYGVSVNSTESDVVNRSTLSQTEPVIVISSNLYNPNVKKLSDVINAPELYTEYPEAKNIRVEYSNLNNGKIAEIINPNNSISNKNVKKIFDNLQSSLNEKPKNLSVSVYPPEVQSSDGLTSYGTGQQPEISKVIPLGKSEYIPGQTPIAPYTDTSRDVGRFQPGETRELEPIILQNTSEIKRNTPFRIREVNIPGLDFEKYKMVVGDIESSNYYGQFNKQGFLGRYQMGAEALFDAGYVTVKNNKQLDDPKNWNGPYAIRNNIKSKDDFLNSPAAQDDAFAHYTNSNYKTFKKAGLMGETLEPRDIVELATGGYGSQNALNYWKYGKDLQGETLRNNPGGIRGYAEKFSQRWFGNKELASPTERRTGVGGFIESLTNVAADVLDAFANVLTGKPINSLEEVYPKSATQRQTNNPDEPLSSLYEPSLLPGDVTTRARPNEPELKTLRNLYPEYVNDRNASQVPMMPKFNMESFKPVSEGLNDFGDMIINVVNQGMQQATPAVNETINSVDMDSLKDIFNSSMMRYTYSHL